MRRRVPVAVGFLALSALLVAIAGLPDRPYLVFWLFVVGTLVCWRNPRAWAQVLYDWLPVLLIAGGYDLVRSYASDLLPRAIVTPQLRFDEVVFGGTAPTVLLQRWLHPGGTPHWWDYLAFTFYLSHFVLTPLFALSLYRRHRARFKRFAWALVTLSLAGFVTYFLLPAAPPWLASRYHDLAPTKRVVESVWVALGATGPARVFNGSTKLANPVAALPSLHAAWPFMIILSVWRTAPRGRWVAVAYMAVMAFVLVYGAEHYVSDILLGWLYASVVFIVVNRTFDRRAITSTLEGAGG